nr:hypothetical protein [Tanacetum cinerariifolium]
MLNPLILDWRVFNRGALPLKATILEAGRDAEIQQLKASPLKVQGELLSLAASVEFERGLKMDRTKEKFFEVLNKISYVMPGAHARLAKAFPLSTVTPVSTSLEFPSNDVPSSSTTPLGQNEEWINDMVDVPSNEMADGAANDKPKDMFMQGISHAIGEDVGLPLAVHRSYTSDRKVDFRFSILAFFASFIATSGSFPAASTMGLVLIPTDTSWLRSSSLMDASHISSFAFGFKDLGRCVIRNL